MRCSSTRASGCWHSPSFPAPRGLFRQGVSPQPHPARRRAPLRPLRPRPVPKWAGAHRALLCRRGTDVRLRGAGRPGHGSRSLRPRGGGLPLPGRSPRRGKLARGALPAESLPLRGSPGGPSRGGSHLRQRPGCRHAALRGWHRLGARLEARQRPDAASGQPRRRGQRRHAGLAQREAGPRGLFGGRSPRRARRLRLRVQSDNAHEREACLVLRALDAKEEAP